MSASSDATPYNAETARKTRRIGITAVAATVAVAAAAYGAYYGLVLDHYESTDDAYVQGDVVQITPQVAGTVVSIGADDTDFVKAGQTLVKLDEVDADVALEQAEAQLAQTVREVRTLYADDDTLAAQVALRDAEVGRAQADFAKASDDVKRRESLTLTGAVGREEYAHATAQLAAARSALAGAQASALAARQQLAANKTLTDGTTADTHPNVRRAAARVREAYIALHRSELPAPVDGYVAKRGVQVGQKVAPGTPLMAVVPLGGVWVDANFKESQLRGLRIGQPVILSADVYGHAVKYHGEVAGLGAGTGSAFSLLPAQNATGNWIKIVQRVPVRIGLRPEELARHPLEIGLSMDVTVDVRDASGKVLADAPRAHSIASTEVFRDLERDADSRVQQIVVSNSPRRVHDTGEAGRTTAISKSAIATHAS